MHTGYNGENNDQKIESILE